MRHGNPTLVYYEILNYQASNRALMEDYFNVVTLPDPDYDTPEILERAEVILAPLGFTIGSEKIDSCPKLKIIGSNTTGEPHIDRAYAEAKGITVISLMGDNDFLATITPTAEHTWGLILAVTRRLPWAFEAVLNGTWRRWDFGAERMLSTMDLGIFGLGRLGRMVASYGVTFGMKVRFYDPYVNDPVQPHWKRAGTPEELVRSSDIVSLHVPLNDETNGLIDRKVLDQFKRGSYLINTARAEVVDKKALLEALQSKRLAGAGLDVLDGEYNKGFNPSEHELVSYAREQDNLVITPHIGGSTIDAWRLTQERTIRRVISVFENGISVG